MDIHTMWVQLIELLPHMPKLDRVLLVQEVIQRTGPVPNDLGEQVRTMIS